MELSLRPFPFSGCLSSLALFPPNPSPIVLVLGGGRKLSGSESEMMEADRSDRARRLAGVSRPSSAGQPRSRSFSIESSGRLLVDARGGEGKRSSASVFGLVAVLRGRGEAGRGEKEREVGVGGATLWSSSGGGRLGGAGGAEGAVVERAAAVGRGGGLTLAGFLAAVVLCRWAVGRVSDVLGGMAVGGGRVRLNLAKTSSMGGNSSSSSDNAIRTTGRFFCAKTRPSIPNAKLTRRPKEEDEEERKRERLQKGVTCRCGKGAACKCESCGEQPPQKSRPAASSPARSRSSSSAFHSP